MTSKVTLKSWNRGSFWPSWVRVMGQMPISLCGLFKVGAPSASPISWAPRQNPRTRFWAWMACWMRWISFVR